MIKPIYQTRFGYPHGNCFAACIASLLGITIEEAEPTSCGSVEGEVLDWERKVEAFLRARNLHLVTILWDSTKLDTPPFAALADGAYCIASGPSPRNKEYNHAVVVKCEFGKVGATKFPKFKIEHDPFPYGTGIESITSLEFLVPFSLLSL